MKKKKNNNNLKIIFIAIGICLCIIISILVGIYSLKEDNSSNIGNSVQQSVETIINNLGSKFIAQKKSEESGFNYDIYLEFKEDIYVDGESNERLYTNLMSQVISNLKTSVRFIDESQDLIIRATYVAEENRYYYTVNGEEDYFLKSDNKFSLENSIGDNFIDLRVQSEELKNTIDSNWNYEEENFGSKESDFNQYSLFWEEGIKVRKIQNSIYNIVFNDKYKQNVVNNINVQTDFDSVIEKLGAPAFGSIRTDCIGYKTEDFYIFFSKNQVKGNEISIYKNSKSNVNEFEDNLSKFLNSEIDIKTFMNNLTYIWPDYESYTYSNNYLKIIYPDKGVKIEYGENTSDEIIVYENYSFTDISKELLEKGDIQGKFTESLFLEVERERLNSDFRIKNDAQYMFEFTDKFPIISNKYMYSFEKNLNGDIKKIFFISKDGEKYFDKELREDITNGIIINDDYFVYGIKNKGIYVFNMLTNEKNILISGDDEFYIEKFEGNILYYDKESISLELE